MRATHHLRAKLLIGDPTAGEALISTEPLSFWGGYDHRTGEIIDRRHPLSGQNAAGKILIMPFSRGSSTTTAVLLEAMRAGTAPAAIITPQVDAFFALASIVAKQMGHKPIPLMVVTTAEIAAIRNGDWLVLEEQDGKN